MKQPIPRGAPLKVRGLEQIVPGRQAPDDDRMSALPLRSPANRTHVRVRVRTLIPGFAFHLAEWNGGPFF